MKYFAVSTGIFFTLVMSRFIPHPPNFTSLLALAFYVPALLGIRYLPALIVSFIITDLFIGFHPIVFFTWGSVIFISLMAKNFVNSLGKRIFGALFGAFIFYIITNFGVWSTGVYGYNINGLTQCYILAIPFFAYSLISTLIFSVLIEMICKIKYLRIKSV